MHDEKIISPKSKAFALRCIRLYKYLTQTSEIKEYVMSRQMLRSGTSIGANIKEGLYAQSRADFGTKMTIALKEAAETEYWIELLLESEYITKEQADSLLYDCRELIKLLVAITKSIFGK